MAAQEAGQWSQAEESFSAVIKLDACNAEANYRLGCMALEAGYPDDALAMANTALASRPSHQPYQKLKALSLKRHILDLSKASKWADLLVQAKALSKLHSEQAEAYGWVATAYMKLGQMNACRAAFLQRMQSCPDDPILASQWLGLHAGDPNTGPEAYYQIARAWDARFHSEPKVAPPLKRAGAQQRIGFVSKTLYHHANANFLLPLLKQLNKFDVELYAYHDSEYSDTVTNQIKSTCSAFRTVAKMSLEDAAETIRKDQLDILFDINGHFDCSRMCLFNYRPAPIQVHYLGGTGALAMRSMDWRIADDFTEPKLGEDREHDAIYRLEGGMHAFQPLDSTVMPTESPALKNGYVTFGCCNALHKIEKPILQLWAKVLQACPASRLLIIKDIFSEKQNRESFGDFAAGEGIPLDRLDLRPTNPEMHYTDLSVYNSIDIALDTSPYNGITTTCEALWMGVPVVTLCGDRFVAREAASLIRQAGHPEWVADTTEAYVEICHRLAQLAPEPISMRTHRSGAFQKSPACDAQGLAQKIVDFCKLAV